MLLDLAGGNAEDVERAIKESADWARAPLTGCGREAKRDSSLREPFEAQRKPAPRKRGGRKNRVAPFRMTVCGWRVMSGLKVRPPKEKSETLSG